MQKKWLRKLSDFMTQFDANLVLYHPYGRRRIRWCTTHSTRFLHGLLAGIPQVLPQNVFCASEEIIRKHDIGYPFSAPIDLAVWLGKPEAQRSRENAQRLAPVFTAEANVPILVGFFESIV